MRFKAFAVITILFALVTALLVSEIACNKEKGEQSSTSTKLSPKKATRDFLRLVVVKKDFKKAYDKYTNKAESYREFYEIEKNIFIGVKKYKIIEEKGPRNRALRQFTVALLTKQEQSRVVYMLVGSYIGGSQVEVSTTPFAGINE